MHDGTPNELTEETRTRMARIDAAFDLIEDRIAEELCFLDPNPRCKDADCFERFPITAEQHDRMLDLDHVEGGLGLQVVCDVLDWFATLPEDDGQGFTRSDFALFVALHSWPETGEAKIGRLARFVSGWTIESDKTRREAESLRGALEMVRDAATAAAN